MEVEVGWGQSVDLALALSVRLTSQWVSTWSSVDLEGVSIENRPPYTSFTRITKSVSDEVSN